MEKKIYKKIFLVLVLVLGGITFYALQVKSTPRFVLLLGRFHPLLLHLPIGALILTFFIDVLGRIQKNYGTTLITNMLGFTSFVAILTCFLGYFLSLEGGYAQETLDFHLYSGIITAVLITGLFLLSTEKRSSSIRKLFMPMFILTLISISVAGHFGSVLTHGDNFLTEYATSEKKQKTIEEIDSLRLYTNVVSTILDKKCIQCHNNSKKKGGLSLISKSHILKGGESGTVVKANNSNRSNLYTHLILPISDEDHMPPEGKEQLTKDEIWLIKHWIEQGLDFEGQVKNTATNDTLKRLLESYLVLNKIEIPLASQDDIEELRSKGYRIINIVPGEPELSVKCLNPKPTKGMVDALSELNEQIVELDFGSSEITDEMTAVFEELKNLKTLRLNSQKITDQSIDYLKELEQVEVLNIYNTQISNEGLSELLNSIQPRQIYTWGTKVSKEMASQLAADFKIKIHNSIKKGFVEESRLEFPLIIPDNTIFEDSIVLKIKSRLKGVDLRYTLDGKAPDSTSQKITSELTLRNSQTLRLAAFKTGWLPSEVLTKEYSKVKYKIPAFKMKEEPDTNYSAATMLFDLEEGSPSFKDGRWVGYFGSDLITTIDLGEPQSINNISFNCLEDVGSWILYPKKLTIYGSQSPNGQFKKLGEQLISRHGEGGEAEVRKVTLSLSNTTVQYVKIQIQNHKRLPNWHSAAGNPSWLFVDEIYFW